MSYWHYYLLLLVLNLGLVDEIWQILEESFFVLNIDFH